MRAVVQRVKHASVKVDTRIVGEIGQGILVLAGIADGDTRQDCDYLAQKIGGLRIFQDTDEKMNLSVQDINGEILAVSQFTLLGDCRKGKRPSFVKAAKPEIARELFSYFLVQLKTLDIRVETGIFQADMAVTLQNDGPVTLLLDSHKEF